jgi:cyclase
MQSEVKSLPKSKHFELKRLADGINAAIALPGGAASSNAGIIDLGDRTVVFDTFETPSAAKDLQVTAEQLTGRTVTCVINSHAHSDHWMGNQVFHPQATILATHSTRGAMPEFVEYINQIKKDSTVLENDIRLAEARLEIETDPRWRATLSSQILRMHYDLEDLPALELHMPDQTFEGEFLFHGTQRQAKLLGQYKGHTNSDACLFLPEEKIVFMGDLGFFNTQPFLAFSDPEQWRRQLEEMEQMDYEVFVPGHGPVGTKADIALQKEYMKALDELVKQVLRRGGTVDEALLQPLPAPFDGWLTGGMNRFERNVRSAYERLSGKGM